MSTHKFTRIHDRRLVEGSALQGCITAAYSELVSQFGEPDPIFERNVSVEWILQFADGTIATIYNWKRLSPPELNTLWNVGGFTSRAVTQVNSVVVGLEN